MVALASVLIIVLISLILTRIATVALIQTGLSRETARFQARSAPHRHRPRFRGNQPHLDPLWLVALKST